MRERTQARSDLFALALLFCGAFLISCSDGLLMDGSATPNRAAVSQLTSFKAGQVQLASEDLPLQWPGVTTSTWNVSVVSSAGDLLLQKTLEATEKVPARLTANDWNSMFSQEKFTPRLTLKVVVTSKDHETSTADVPFFLFRQLPELSVSTVPVEVEPSAWLGSQAWLGAEDASSYDKGGWIVWKIAGKVLTEGPLQDRSLFWWKAQSQAGTSEMSADWYPEAPDPNALETLAAPVSVVSRPVVTTTPLPISGELVPEVSYDGLWHFRGTLTNRTNGKSFETSGVSETSWTINHGSLAAWLPDKTQWSGPGIDALQGQWKPFTFNFVYKPTISSSDIVLWQTLDKDGNPLLQVVQTSVNSLLARVVAPGGIAQEVGGQFFIPEEFTAVSLAVFPNGEDWAVTWSVDGFEVQTGFWSKAKGLPASVGGATQVWKGPALWDEAGVYVKTPEGASSTDPQVFSRALEAQFGSDLVLAEGFDGLQAPKGWVIPKQNAYLAAVLQPQETVRSAPVTVPEGALEFRQKVSSSSTSFELRAIDSEGRVLWTGAPKEAGAAIIWNRKEGVSATVRIEWKNTGSEPITLDELTIIRKME